MLMKYRLKIITKERRVNEEYIETPRIGDILKEEFLDPLGVTPYRLSKAIRVSTSSVLDLIHNKRRISVEMALRLSKFFGTSQKFWLNLQNEIDIRELTMKLDADLKEIHLFNRSA
jgi:addiction module HigA family antidote